MGCASSKSVKMSHGDDVTHSSNDATMHSDLISHSCEPSDSAPIRRNSSKRFAAAAKEALSRTSSRMFASSSDQIDQTRDPFEASPPFRRNSSSRFSAAKEALTRTSSKMFRRKSSADMNATGRDETKSLTRSTPSSSVVSRLRMGTKACDWEAEASRLANNLPTEYSVGTDNAAYTITDSSHALWLRATENEQMLIVQAFGSNSKIQRVEMVNAMVSDVLAQAWGDVLKRNRTLTILNLESNSISTSGITALADGLRENRSLKELKLANQRLNYTQQAEEQLANSLEGNHVLSRLTVDLRNTRARELINKYLQRNQDEIRRERMASRASAKSVGAVNYEPSVKLNVADWAAEAERVASSKSLSYGMEPDAQSYILTSNRLWGQATDDEKQAVVKAFKSNNIVQRVEMVNAMVTDVLAQAWGDVLKRNRTLTILNLESNSISTSGIKSLADGLRENRSLTELKLANQRLNYTQQAEEQLANSLEGNHTLKRLTVDLRNTRARELINKYLQRNQDEVRLERMAARASAKSVGAVNFEPSVKLNVADWAAEAERVASSKSLSYGMETDAQSYVLTSNRLWGQATDDEKQAVVKAFKSNNVVQQVEMVNAMVTDVLAQAWGDVLKRNRTLTILNLESNSISTSGIKSLADGLRENRSLTELKLANQRLNYTQQAEEQLANSLEGNHTLKRLTVDLRSTRARELITKYLQRNQDEVRLERMAARASAKSVGAVNFEPSVKLNVADWAAEAERVASSKSLSYGMETDAQSYVLTSNRLWGQATDDEKQAVVKAFKSNNVVQRVEMVNAMVTDVLAQAWGDVLKRNRTLTILNLESNSISTSGIKSLADGLRENRSLTELKLANQRLNYTQQAEEQLANSLEGNHTLKRLTVDLRSTRARELINKYLQRNQDEVRRERMASRSSAKSVGAVNFEPSVKLNVADWAAEAKRIASSTPMSYGMETDDAQSYVLTNNRLWGQATDDEKQAVVKAFKSNNIVQRVEMVNAMVTDVLAQAWGDVLKRNRTLTILNLESNSISASGIKSLADGLRENRSLTELKLANQRTHFVQAEEYLAHSIEDNHTLKRLTIDLRNTRARELINKYLQRNQDEDRRERMAAKASVGAEHVVASRVKRNVADWAAEAERVASSKSLSYGMESDTQSYILTSNSLWSQATDDEKQAVVKAFKSNNIVQQVEMVNAMVSDVLAQAWGDVLKRNRTLTILNLESNSISTMCVASVFSLAFIPFCDRVCTCAFGSGITALADGLRENRCLKEVKLANQKSSFSQQAEEYLANSLEGNHTLKRLTVDLRSTQARELINEYLQRNYELSIHEGRRNG
ncbi:hypothetical protein AB1Y20_009002 [Prymnesium parvum]|uniref:Uncharacterized protein n=1 Tax=Prymnesium parvum TaxID=97485 RepID=A0AB34K064_PRYPA